MASISFVPLHTHLALITQSCQEINEKRHLKVIWLFFVYFTVRESDQHHSWEPRDYSGRAKSFTTCHGKNRPVAEYPLTTGFTHGVHTSISCLRLQTASSQTAPHRTGCSAGSRREIRCACVVESACVMESTVKINF